MGYTQATFAWKMFIFSSFVHTKTIQFSIIWDSQPWVQPWAIPRLHFHEGCLYSLHIFTQKQYIFDYWGILTFCTALSYTQATCLWKLFIFSSLFHTKTIHLFIIVDSRSSVQPWAISRLHFSQNAVTFFSHVHTKTIHLFIIGDSRPSVQPWAIPRLHVSQNAVTYFSRVHTKTIHCWCWRMLISHLNIMLM
jgi:hypothetical protein